MWAFIHKIYSIASPQTSYRWAKNLQPWFGGACFVALGYGLIGGLFMAPPDYQQGDVFRIMYLHVPTAIWSLGIYIGMSIAVVFYFIWQLKVADIIAKVSAPIGASFTLLCLLTGSIWGKPTWGTFWIWDARLTTELILLFIYCGVMALRSAIPEPQLAARASGIITLVGLVNIPIIHYSVNWWNTLHQGSSLSLVGSTIAPSMLHPLMAMIVAFLFFYCWLVAIKVRAEILLREQQTTWVRTLIQENGA